MLGTCISTDDREMSKCQGRTVWEEPQNAFYRLLQMYFCLNSISVTNILNLIETHRF